MDKHRLRNDQAEATIAPLGAELQALRLGGLDLLWNAGPLWPRHAPLLFPVVGALAGDQLRHQGRSYPMPKHGFARDRAFTWTRRDEAACSLELRDDASTRASYPFAFQLSVAYALEGTTLRMDLALHNPGPEPLPASLGLHPAFRWPLAPGLPRKTHRLVFAQAEPGPLRRLDSQGLLRPEPHPTPIQDRTLDLREDLFQDDALLFLETRSRALRYEAQGGPGLNLAWEGFPHLGVWTKPNLGPEGTPAFLCIEPWQGYADPEGFAGEFTEKPGSFLVAPGGTREWSFSVEMAHPTDQKRS